VVPLAIPLAVGHVVPLAIPLAVGHVVPLAIPLAVGHVVPLANVDLINRSKTKMFIHNIIFSL